MSAQGALSLKEAAARAGVTPQTLRRWADDGVVPRAREDGWTDAAVAHARVVARLRERGHTLKEIREATRNGKLAFSYVEDLLPPPRPAYTLEEAAAETGLEPGLIARIYVAQGFTTGIARADLRGRPPAAALRRRGAPGGPAAGRAAAARARLRTGAGAGRRRRGAPVPSLRPRAADARRRPRRGDGRGDGGPGPRPAAAVLADHGPRAPALPGALRRAGRHRAHGGRPRGRAGPRAPARHDRLRRPRRLHQADRGGRARRRPSARSSASSRRSRRRCPTRPGSSRRSATR